MPARRKKKRSRARSRRSSAPRWARWSDERLLDLRMNRLGLKIDGTKLERRIARLHEELERAGFRFRPHCWLSDDWFSPDGVPGIAIPFYLAHPRLMQLERREMLHVEGETRDACMKILRHEAGHAMCAAYRLHRRREWRKHFGPAGRRYPEEYTPKPFSRSYVIHLDWWYAQSHPLEDFAETFAEWLRPGSAWRRRYSGWPALKKLQYVDRLMKEIRGARPKVANRMKVAPLSSLRKTLRSHYRQRKRKYADDQPDIYDRDLRKLFPGDPHRGTGEAGSAFLRRHREGLRSRIAPWIGLHPYTVDQVLKEMILRCRALRLRTGRSERETLLDATVLLSIQTTNLLHGGYRHIAV